MDSLRSCSTSEKTLSTFCSFSLSVSIILGSSRRYPVIYMVGYTKSKCKQKTYHLVLLVKANLKWHKPKNVHLGAPDRTSLFKWWVMQSIACNLADTSKYTQNKLSPARWLYSPFNQQWTGLNLHCMMLDLYMKLATDLYGKVQMWSLKKG